MNLTDLVDHLCGFRRVVVTGPQRSGTTLAAKILADRLKVDLVLEEAFREDDVSLFGAALAARADCVVQAPALCSVVHLLRAPDICVVFMKRALEDIIASQERISWTSTHEDYEKAKYHLASDPRPIALVKLEAWEGQKRLLGRRAFELNYDSLAASEKWVPRERRIAFGPRQTEESPNPSGGIHDSTSGTANNSARAHE